jgi:hypothetical protein
MKNLKVILLCVFLLASLAQAQYRPQLTILDDWELIAQNDVREGTIQDIGLWESATLYISIAVASNTTEHTEGTVFHIQTSPLDSTDEMWLEQASYTMGVAITGSNTVLDVTPNSGSTTILINNSATNTLGRFNDDGTRFIFLQGSTVTNSEICTLVSHSTGAATSVTILDGLTNTPGASSTLWDWADTQVHELPKHTNRVRVVHDNSYDSDGAPVYTYVAIFGIRP